MSTSNREATSDREDPRPTALIIKHDPFAYPGYLGERLEQRGFELRELTVTTSMSGSNPSVAFENPGDVELVVPLGSVWSVYDHDTIGNWIGAELDYIRASVEADVPVLGVCFGGQALSAALGGTVEPTPHPEIGWHHVRSERHPEVFATGPWMQWHFDRFTVPEGGVELASNDAAPQAFSFGRSLGLQFHPEVSVEIIDTWIRSEGPDGPDLPDGVELATVLADTRRHAPPTRPRTHALVDFFLDRIARFEGIGPAAQASRPAGSGVS